MRIDILWDASDIWGTLALWYCRSLGLPYRLLRGVDADSLASDPPTVLLVPGGPARGKASALGERGMKAVRSYVRKGGFYIGFCGGAGLALTGTAGLGLCPWRRGRYTDHMQHLMSGHVYGSIADADLATRVGGGQGQAMLPVWWPGRFEPDSGGESGDVRVVVRYDTPGPDFQVADIAVAALPPDTFPQWEKRYGLAVQPDFLSGQPCIVDGRLGEGGYLLSYSHLETPASPDANACLAHTLRAKGLFVPDEGVPDWNLDHSVPVWADKHLERIQSNIDTIFDLGLETGLFYSRTSWLTGWRSGLPGSSLNTLRSLVGMAAGGSPTEAATAYLAAHGRDMVSLAAALKEKTTRYLLAERLAQTLTRSLPEELVPERLREERDRIFGPAMDAPGQGLAPRLKAKLQRLVYYQYGTPTRT